MNIDSTAPEHLQQWTEKCCCSKNIIVLDHTKQTYRKFKMYKAIVLT